MINDINRKYKYLLGFLFVLFALVINYLRGVFSFAGIEAADGSSNYYYDFSFPSGFLGGTRTFPYPLFILIIRLLKIPLFILPEIQFAILLAIIWLLFLEICKYLPAFVLIPFMISSAFGSYVPFSNFIGNEFFALSLFYSAILFLLIAHRTQKLQFFCFSTFLFFTAVLTRAAFIGPILFILLCYIVIHWKVLRKVNFLKNMLATFGLLFLLMFGFSSVKYYTVNSFGLASTTGGLFAGHAALFDSEPHNFESEFAGSIGSKWVSEARIYLDEPCKSYSNSFNSWKNLRLNNDLHYQCYSELLMSTWVIAIYDTTGNLPLPKTEPFRHQVNAWKYSWPNSAFSLDSFFSKYYDINIDHELNAYSIRIISGHFDSYARYIVSAFVFGFLDWMSNLAFTNHFFDWSTLDSLLIVILFIIFYSLTIRKFKGFIFQINRRNLFILLISPLTLIFFILIFIVPINVVHFRFHVIFTPLLILNISIITHLISLGLIHNNKQRMASKP
jgi:hypothetical protein